ncbi:MAG: PAS domain S-box protein [Bacteroidetes bacterium]|nr:PAS domain S-box protein [Bacteroidota bacterium]
MTTDYRYKQMIDSIEDYAIILLDPTGHIQSWNKGAGQIKGWTADEILGRHFRTFYTEEDRQRQLPETYLTEATDLGHVQHEGWRVRRDGSLFWGHVTITALRDESGRISGFCKVTYDRTDRLRREEIDRRMHQLEARNKEMEQFAYVASHDLSEPLNTVGSFASLLASDYAAVLDSTGRAYLTQIQTSVGRMKELITALLHYARIGTYRSLERVDLVALLRSVMTDMHQTIVSSGARISYHDLPTLYAYPIELRVLLQNLLSNAIKFHAPGTVPRIHISAARQHHVWTFCVADNGIGIAAADYDKVFIMFKRLHDQDTYAGSGIGLAYARKIVEMHNGSIWIEPNEPSGIKVCFTIKT